MPEEARATLRPVNVEGEPVGSSYENITLVGVDVSRLTGLGPRPCLATQSANDLVLFPDVEFEGTQDAAMELSAALSCVAIASTVFDSDVFGVAVFSHGEAVANFTVPDMLEYSGASIEELAEIEGVSPEDVASMTSPPDIAAVAAAVGRGDVAVCEEAIGHDYVFAEERHGAFNESLGLPEAAVGWGYRYLTMDPSDGGPAVVELP